MKPMISSLSALVAVFLFSAPVAMAQSCSEQAASLQAQQVEAQAIAEARVTLVDEVEAAGDAWDDVEIHRLASKAHAAKADEAKLAYEALKADLFEKESSLQLLVASLNKDVAAYNTKCVTN